VSPGAPQYRNCHLGSPAVQKGSTALSRSGSRGKDIVDQQDALSSQRVPQGEGPFQVLPPHFRIESLLRWGLTGANQKPAGHWNPPFMSKHLGQKQRLVIGSLF